MRANTLCVLIRRIRELLRSRRNPAVVEQLLLWEQELHAVRVRVDERQYPRYDWTRTRH